MREASGISGNYYRLCELIIPSFCRTQSPALGIIHLWGLTNFVGPFFFCAVFGKPQVGNLSVGQNSTCAVCVALHCLEADMRRQCILDAVSNHRGAERKLSQIIAAQRGS